MPPDDRRARGCGQPQRSGSDRRQNLMRPLRVHDTAAEPASKVKTLTASLPHQHFPLLLPLHPTPPLLPPPSPSSISTISLPPPPHTIFLTLSRSPLLPCTPFISPPTKSPRPTPFLSTSLLIPHFLLSFTTLSQKRRFHRRVSASADRAARSGSSSGGDAEVAGPKRAETPGTRGPPRGRNIRLFLQHDWQRDQGGGKAEVMLQVRGEKATDRVAEDERDAISNMP